MGAVFPSSPPIPGCGVAEDFRTELPIAWGRPALWRAWRPLLALASPEVGGTALRDLAISQSAALRPRGGFVVAAEPISVRCSI